MRLSSESNRHREREEQARRYFDRHGRWLRRGADVCAATARGVRRALQSKSWPRVRAGIGCGTEEGDEWGARRQRRGHWSSPWPSTPGPASGSPPPPPGSSAPRRSRKRRWGRMDKRASTLRATLASPTAARDPGRARGVKEPFDGPVQHRVVEADQQASSPEQHGGARTSGRPRPWRSRICEPAPGAAPAQDGIAARGRRRATPGAYEQAGDAPYVNAVVAAGPALACSGCRV
jgi:hypothetical protein